MAKKNKKKGGFAIMDFLIVGGIAAVAYFLFSSFKKATPIITPPVLDPNTTINPAGGAGGSGAGGAGVNPAEVYFSGSERAQQLVKGYNTNPINSVKAVQVFLTKSGHSTQGIDGIFGDNTENAIDAYFGTSSLFSTPVTLEELGIYAINFSNNRIFGKDPRGSVLSGSLPKEYINKTTGWVVNDDSMKAYEFFKN
jgi:hypothetical protein